MTTKSQINSIVKTLARLDSAPADTFFMLATEITGNLTTNLGQANWDIEPETVEEIVAARTETAAWKGTAAEKVRKSELRAIIRGYPFLASASKHFRAGYPLFGKEQLLKIARYAPQCPDAESTAFYAIEFFEAKDSASAAANTKTQEQKLIAALKTARTNCKGSKMLADLDEFLAKYKLVRKVIG